MSHIFISYSHKDKKYVEKLEAKLLEEGFNVWIDHRVDYGTKWPVEIQQALDECDAFVLVVTKNAFESEWVQNEVARAKRKRKPFFPLLLQGDTWLSVEATQYVNVKDGSLPPEKFYQRLACTIPIRKSLQDLKGIDLGASPESCVATSGRVLGPKGIKELSSSPKPQHIPSSLWREKLVQNLRRLSVSKQKDVLINSALIGALVIVIAILIVIVFQIFQQINYSNGIAGPSSITNPLVTPSSSSLLFPSGQLEAPYTPTPLYVNMPRVPISIDLYQSAISAYEQQDWDAVISGMQEIAQNEPEAADPYYYIGEAYRFKGDHRKAMEAYNQALKIDPQFGPAYLGLARTRLMQDPNANVTMLLDEALKRDPNFGEVYLERAMCYLKHEEPELALADLSTAERLMPGSPLVYYYQARANLILEDANEAEVAALKAKEADPTMLPVYFTLGEIYLVQGKYADAGEAYYRAGDCETAIKTLDFGHFRIG